MALISMEVFPETTTQEYLLMMFYYHYCIAMQSACEGLNLNNNENILNSPLD